MADLVPNQGKYGWLFEMGCWRLIESIEGTVQEVIEALIRTNEQAEALIFHSLDGSWRPA